MCIHIYICICQSALANTETVAHACTCGNLDKKSSKRTGNINQWQWNPSVYAQSKMSSLICRISAVIGACKKHGIACSHILIWLCNFMQYCEL